MPGTSISGTNLLDPAILAGKLEPARDAAGLCNAFGITATIPAAGDQLGVWNIREETQAAYLMTRFKGMYEKGQLSTHIAYNRRDKFLSGMTNIVGIGALPNYTKDYGWLDASVSYRVNDHVTLALEGTNLLRTVRTAYYGVETRPQSAWVNDRQVSLTAAIRF